MTKLWKKIRKWIKDHDTEIIATLVAILIYTAWHEYQDSKTAELTAAHIESITATQNLEKEVKTNAETIRRLHADNDKNTDKAVADARSSIPSDIADLVSLANEIIRGSNTGQR